MKKEKSAARVLGKYLRWPILFVVLMLVSTALVYIRDESAIYIAMCMTGLGIIAAILIYLFYRHSITSALVTFAMNAEVEQKWQIEALDVPYTIVDKHGKLLWHNRAFDNVITGDKYAVKEISALFADIDEGTLAQIDESEVFHVGFRDKKYQVVIRETEMDTQKAFAVYLYDETELVALRVRYDNDTQTVGLLYLDNYEEVTQSVEEVKRSLLVALVDRSVSKYITDVNGIVKKLEKDKYIFLIKKMYLEQLTKERFSILEDVKKVNIGNEINVTVSIGIGLSENSFAGNYNNAKTAIDMALARGGDQAVIKDGRTISYFGGKSQSIEKSTRVKARVKAEALKEILSANDSIVVMGHKMMDIDCLGSAVGIWKIAGALGKEAHIIVGESSGSIRQILDRFSTSEYPKDMFITRSKAMELMNESTVLAVVDVNKPGLTEAPELIDVANAVVVFDHHRQGSEVIPNATLSYIEPYASSACEMITEVLQYIDDDVRMRFAEADAMFAGIAVDTYNFTNQAGVRTFEAAAFLRKNGADVTRVRKLFRDSLEDYRAKAEAIHMAEIYESSYAISECNGEGLVSPTIVGAQAANELLDIEGIKASFVLTRFRDQIFISARSIDEVNVQIIMEKLGGGGHRSIAGAQLDGVNVAEARRQLRIIISDMIKEGELDK